MVPNRTPEPVGTITDREVYVGDAIEIDVAAHFTDPDGDDLEYAVASSDTLRAVVVVTGGMVTVTGAAVGSAAVTVTARDPEGLSAGQAFAVTVPNRAPEPLGTIADREVYVGDTVAVDIAAHFTEPDGEELEYAAASSSPVTATVAVSGSTVTVAGVAVGGATLTVTAQDPHGVWAEQSFAVTVPNRAPGTVGRIADREVEVDSVVVLDVATRFTEPDGEALEYAATSSDATRVGVAMSGSTLTVTGVAAGFATVTVTARDPGGLEAVQGFEVTVPNRAPVAVGTIAHRVVAAGNSVTVDVAANFTDPDGDPLRYSASSSDPARATVAVSGSVVTVTGVAGGNATVTVTAQDSAGAILPDIFTDPDGDDLTWSTLSANSAAADSEISGDSIIVNAVAVGSATITVTATDPEGLFATDEFDVEVVADRFDMDLYVTDDVTDSQFQRMQQARNGWESVLAGTELNDVSYSFLPSCHGLVPPSPPTVDDHAVFVDVDGIDGVGGTLAFAGYCHRRTADGTPIISVAVFDEADINRVSAFGNLVGLAFHEFAHGLGFLESYWEDHGLLETGTDPHFTGALAIAAFNSAGGTTYPGAKVPISSPDHSHWRESVFDREGMTPTFTLGVINPFSAITLQAMADVGYVVDVSLADAYQLPNTVPPDVAGQVFDLSNDVVRGPVMVIETDGRIVRVVPAPPGSVLPSFRRQVVRIDRRGSDGPGTWVRSPSRQDPPRR